MYVLESEGSFSLPKYPQITCDHVLILTLLQNPPKPPLKRYAIASQSLPQQRITIPRGHLSAMGKIPRVAIIGAGVSGLRCADILGQNGAQVTIFEARDRVGGRVGSIKHILLPSYRRNDWLTVNRSPRARLGVIWLICKVSCSASVLRTVC